MKKLKHSKYRNTGLIFELLSRKLVQETLANSQLKALKIITKHFGDSKPLAQELKLYTALTENSINSQLVEKVVDTVEKVHEKLDLELLEIARYNLVRDVKSAYGLDEFFNCRTTNYTKLASVYKFLYYKPADNPVEYVENRASLMEMASVEDRSSTSESIKQWQAQDPAIRKLGFQLAVDHFNTKYAAFLPKQKELLREYIMRDPASADLKQYVNDLIVEVVSDINKKVPSIKDVALKVKLTEGISLVSDIKNAPVIKDNHFNAVLKLCQLQENINFLTK